MRIQFFNSKVSTLLIGLSLMGASSCTKRAPDAAAAADPATTLVANVKAINDSLVPASLKYTSALVSKHSPRNLHLLDGAGPCAGIDGGFFGCQPVLLRLYISIVEQFGGMMATTLTDLSTHLTGLADGATGSVVVEGNTIYYSKTSATEMAILVKTAGDVSMMHITLAGSAFSLKLNFAGLPVEPGSPTVGGFEFSGTFTDADNWSAVAFMSTTACDDNDVGAPGNLRVQMTKTAGLWKGKAMMYNPRGASGTNQAPGNPDVAQTCAVDPTDHTAFAMYTDFMADAAASTATVYLMQRNVANVSDISPYTLDQMYINVPWFSNNATQSSVSGFGVPFCIPTSTMVGTWDDHCASVTASAVSTASYGPATDWIAPATFYPMTVELPTSL